MRFVLALLFSTSILTAQTSVVGIWKLDETSGLTTADIGPFANVGTLVNFTSTSTPAWWVPGRYGNALSFDGVDDYVDIRFNGGLPFYDGLGAAFSVCFWVNGSATDDDRVLSLSSATSTEPLFTLGTGAGVANRPKLRMYLRSDNNVSHVRNSAATVFDNTWHHVSYVEHAGEARLYVDGVLDSTSFHTEPGNDTFTLERLTLGAVVRSSLCCAWGGAIDELQIYAYPLALADVRSVMGGGLPLTPCRASYAEYGTGCGAGPLNLSVAGDPTLGGGGLLFTMRGGPPSGGAALLLGVGKPVPIDLALLGAPGCLLYPNRPLAVGAVTLNPFGATSSQLPFPVPASPALVCLPLTFQSVGFTPGTLVTSDAVLVVLGF